MRWLIAIALMFPIIIISSCSIAEEKKECNIVSDCTKGTCQDGYEYSKFSCVDSKCVEKIFVADPCLGHYGTSECDDDSDCGIGGCSGEICGSKEKIKDIASICLYKEEYKCLKLTKCTCNAGRCSWEENKEYGECLSEFK